MLHYKTSPQTGLLENYMIIEAQYKWNGELSGYRDADRYIPLDAKNSDYQNIQQAIVDGSCTVAEPLLGQISIASDRHGEFSGYHTRFGFVPNYLSSHLLSLIDEQLADGRCTVAIETAELKGPPQTKLHKLIFSTILDQHWTNVSGEFFGELPYASHANSEKRHFKFSINNLPYSSSDKLQLLLEKHAVKKGLSFSVFPAQFGVIEIQVPVAELRRLFKGEQHLIDACMLPFHADLLNQHFAQTRRKRAEGPDIFWLISHANLYMGHFVAEICNKVIEAFSMEYGHVSIPYISGKADRYKTVVLGCSDAGETSLQTFSGNQSRDFDLSGEWHSSSLLHYEEQIKSLGFHQKTALARVSEMVRLGFHAEALGPLNAFFEVVIRWALATCVMDSTKHLQLVEESGHGARLDILVSIVSEQQNSYACDCYFKERLEKVKAIYKHRNYYLHTLQLPNLAGRLTLINRRRLEELFHGFIDVWEQNQFFMRLNTIAGDTDAIRATAKRAIDKRLGNNN